MNSGSRARHGPLPAIAVCAALSAVLPLGGCGQTGPLTLPGYPKNTPWPVHRPPPAPPGAGPSAPAAQPAAAPQPNTNGAAPPAPNSAAPAASTQSTTP